MAINVIMAKLNRRLRTLMAAARLQRPPSEAFPSPMQVKGQKYPPGK